MTDEEFKAALEAEIEAMDKTSLKELCALEGLSVDDVLAKRKRERDIAYRLGLGLDSCDDVPEPVIVEASK